jgi:hypothetical protein
MANPLFSTYSQGENRVTASILAVFERISFAIVEQILQSLLQEPETSLLTFRNQPPGPSSTPDARIRASFSYWIETKRVSNKVRAGQLKAHLKALDAEAPIDTQRLLVLTPDNQIPGAVANTADDRLAWASFEDLVSAINEAIEIDEEWLASERHIPTERERELLRELVRFLISEGLVGKAGDEVLVVAARRALSEYLKHGLYICQANRPFRTCSHMAFYANGHIHHQIPKILGQIEQIMMTQEAVEAYSGDGELRERLLVLFDEWGKAASPRIGEVAKVMFLSPVGDDLTIVLPHDIKNDLVSESGRTIAFTQGQRYVPLERLQKGPRTTTELLGA